jgi:hypothetical protein
VTEDVALPVDMFRYYRELGTFSQEVSQRLQEVPGTIVECVAVVDTGSLYRKFQTRVLEIRTQEKPRGPMGPPPDWEEVEKFDSSQEEPVAKKVRCALEGCDKEIDPDTALRFREPWGSRRVHYVCSPEHRRQLIRRLASQRRK